MTSNDPPQVRLQTVLHIIDIVRVLPSPDVAIATILNGNKDPEFALAVAYVMADNDLLPLRGGGVSPSPRRSRRTSGGTTRSPPPAARNRSLASRT